MERRAKGLGAYTLGALCPAWGIAGNALYLVGALPKRSADARLISGLGISRGFLIVLAIAHSRAMAKRPASRNARLISGLGISGCSS